MIGKRTKGLFLSTGLVFVGFFLGGCQNAKPAIQGDGGAFTTARAAAAGHALATTTVGRDYRIGVPDRVTVTCDRVRGLSVRDVAIDAEGFVVLPTLGRVKIAGLTTDEASEALTRRVRTVDSGATMTLRVTRYASRHIYTFGSVGRIGPVAWRPGMTLADALSGSKLREQANIHQVSVIRPGVPGSATDAPRRVTVDFARLMDQGDASVNVALRAGDVVVVPGSGDAPAWASWTMDDQARKRLASNLEPEHVPQETTPSVTTFNQPQPQPQGREVDWSFNTSPNAAVPVFNPTPHARTPTEDSNLRSDRYFGLNAVPTSPAARQGGVVFWN
ncbi:MAG: polysaccharide biosynthesis/export family protein [Planctomycetota bacterium]